MKVNFKHPTADRNAIGFIVKRISTDKCRDFVKLTVITRSHQLSARKSGLLTGLMVVLVMWCQSGVADDLLEGPVYPVSAITLSYAYSHPSHPPLTDIMNHEMQLGLMGDRYVDPALGGEIETIRLSDLAESTPRTLHASAIQSISQQIVGYMNQLGIIGVYVEPSKHDIDKKSLKDLRSPDNTEFHLYIWTSRIKELRTLASGKRIPPEERINNPSHERILALSPLKPDGYAGSDERQDLLRKDLLDEFVLRLNRHPGRRVDIAISSIGEPGELILDYLVSENRPWLAYAQISNTGTESTDKIRERIGVVFNQFTKNDDVLSLDYITAGFDEAHAVVGSYEFPMLASERLRMRAFGAWNEFTASDLGGTFPLDLEGESWNLGSELVMTVFQHKKLFVDVILGAQFENISVDNNNQGIDGDSDFIIPHLELQVEHLTDTASSFASIDFELIKADLDNASENDLGINKLGRLDVDDAPVVLHWNILHSFYVEPLLFRNAWQDPKTWKSSTLAHELALSLKGQFSFDNRLIPQKQMTAGGFYSVRGYEESETVGDDVYMASIEYRFHLPRAFKPGEPKNIFPKSLSGKHGLRKPKPFRLVPDRVYGRPDWDFIIRAFYDIGDTEVTDRQANEFDETLQSAGIGFELQLLRYVNIRLDWGYVLQDLNGGDTEDGDNRLHFAATFVW